MDRLIPDPEGHGARQADVVIEAIFEDLEAKHALLQDLEAKIRPTRCWPPTPRACASRICAPARPAGTPDRDSLLQPGGADAAGRSRRRRGCRPRNAATRHRLSSGRSIACRCRSGVRPASWSTPFSARICSKRCAPSMKGSTPATVDEAMLAFGMPMGPIELIDMVGLDVAMAAGKSLAGAGAGATASACLSVSTPATSARRAAGVSTSTAVAGRSRARRDGPGRSRRASRQAAARAHAATGERRGRGRRRSGRCRSDLRHRLCAVHRRTAELPAESACLTSSAACRTDNRSCA
jgi:hypothetical protein